MIGTGSANCKIAEGGCTIVACLKKRAPLSIPQD